MSRDGSGTFIITALLLSFVTSTIALIGGILAQKERQEFLRELKAELEELREKIIQKN